MWFNPVVSVSHHGTVKIEVRFRLDRQHVDVIVADRRGYTLSCLAINLWNFPSLSSRDRGNTHVVAQCPHRKENVDDALAVGFHTPSQSEIVLGLNRESSGQASRRCVIVASNGARCSVLLHDRLKVAAVVLHDISRR